MRRGTKLKAEEVRTPSDADRVAAVMLHKDNFRAVEARILSGTRSDRAASDQSVDPQMAWAMDALTLFRKDPEFVVEVPGDGLIIADVKGVDPNSDKKVIWQ